MFWIGAVVLHRVRIAELRAVVGHDASEQFLKQFWPCGIPKHVDDASECLRRLRISQKCKRKLVAHHEGEKHLAAD